MINIIIDSDELRRLQEEGYRYIMLPYKRYETVIAREGKLSDEIVRIITDVESCKFDEYGNIESKFTNTPIGLDRLSEGTKTVMYVYYRTIMPKWQEIINITSCGPNAIMYILENYYSAELTLYLGHLEFPRNVMKTFQINGKIVNGTNEIFLL